MLECVVGVRLTHGRRRRRSRQLGGWAGLGTCCLHGRPSRRPRLSPAARRQVLSELATDKSLERFRLEYEKLFRTLRRSHGARGTRSVTPLGHQLSLGSLSLAPRAIATTNPPLCNAAHTDNERRLVKKCRELNSEIVSNAAKVRQGAMAHSPPALPKHTRRLWPRACKAPRMPPGAKNLS